MLSKSDKPGDPSKPLGRGGPSIRRVAAQAGVSIATVSRVMNSPELVAPETTSRVQKVIEELGYTPHPLAQALGSGESRVLGVALPSFHGQFFAELLRGADAEATRRGYHLAVTSITHHPDGRRREHILGSGLMDGTIIFLDDDNDPLVADIPQSNLPVVAMGADMSARGVDSIALDYQKGIREAVEHLLRWVPPPRLYYVGGPRHNYDTLARAECFRAELARVGWTPQPEQISFGEYSVEWGKEWATRMKQQKLLEGSAVLAANDEVACGIIRAAEDGGLWAPDQFRVVGVDDSPLCTIVRPRLSSVSLPVAEMGATAVSMLIDRLDSRPAQARCVLLPTRLVIRESSTAMSF